jgi:hypothetical protein
MKIDPNDPVYRVGLVATALVIYVIEGYFLHRVFIKKKKIRAKWGRFGGGRVLSRFAYVSWVSLFFIVATDFIYGAISVGEHLPFLGVLYILSIGAILSSVIYDYSRKEERA